MSLFSRKSNDPPARSSTGDLAELHRLRSIVDRHVADYAAVGAALREIRDRQLYRLTHETFEAFVTANWHMERSHAHRLIAAADVAATLSPTGDVPATERQARPLTRLEPSEQLDAWHTAQELAGDQAPTADQVEQAAAIIRPTRKRKTRQAKPLRLRVPGAIVIIQPGRGFSSFEQALRDALNKQGTSGAKAA